MGDPRPGQIPDNVFISIQQIKVGAEVVANAGDWLIRHVGTPTNLWLLAGGSDDDVDLSVRGLVQTRVDIDTTGVPAGEVTVEAFESPSTIYGIAEGPIQAGSLVKLGSDGQTFIPAVAADIAAGKVVGKFSRVATDSAGNNDAVALDVIIIKMGVGA